MKKVTFLFTAMLFVFTTMAFKTQAQTKDYFVGKWEVTVSGTPNGDIKLIVNLERKSAELIATLDLGGEKVKVDRLTETATDVTLYFNASGYDVSLSMEKKDDDHTSGNMMGMFEANGVRVKDNQPK